MAKSNRTYGNNYRHMIYTEGNTVRRMDAMPDYWEQEQEQRRQREKQEQEKRRRQRRQRAIARRNQDRALIMNRSYVVFLTMAVIVTCVTAGFYIKLQSDITIHMEKIAGLEAEVNRLKADNDAADKRLATSVKMEDIRRQATEVLGMDYPDEDQIVYYQIDRADFMSQYGEIPES